MRSATEIVELCCCGSMRAKCQWKMDIRRRYGMPRNGWGKTGRDDVPGISAWLGSGSASSTGCTCTCPDWGSPQKRLARFPSSRLFCSPLSRHGEVEIHEFLGGHNSRSSCISYFILKWTISRSCVISFERMVIFVQCQRLTGSGTASLTIKDVERTSSTPQDPWRSISDAHSDFPGHCRLSRNCVVPI